MHNKKKKTVTSLISSGPYAADEKSTAETILSNVRNSRKESSLKDMLEFSPEIKEQKDEEQTISLNAGSQFDESNDNDNDTTVDDISQNG